MLKVKSVAEPERGHVWMLEAEIHQKVWEVFVIRRNYDLVDIHKDGEVEHPPASAQAVVEEQVLAEISKLRPPDSGFKSGCLNLMSLLLKGHSH